VERSTPILEIRHATAEMALNVTKVNSHGTILQCQDFSPCGQFTPWTFRSMYGHFAPRSIRHRRFTPQSWGKTSIHHPKNVLPHTNLGVIPVRRNFLRQEDNSIPRREKYVPVCTARCNALITLIALVQILLKQSTDRQLLLVG